MGFRFRRSIKILPGVKINISKTGVSTSIGRPGATVNLSSRGVKTTLGIPGSGLSWSTMSKHSSKKIPDYWEYNNYLEPKQVTAQPDPIARCTSSNLEDLRDYVIAAAQKVTPYKNQLSGKVLELERLQNLVTKVSNNLITRFIPFLRKKLLTNLKTIHNEIEKLELEIETKAFRVDFNSDDIHEDLMLLARSAKELRESQAAWEISSHIKRIDLWDWSDPSSIKSNDTWFPLFGLGQNSFVVFHNFIYYGNDRSNIELIDIRDINVEYQSIRVPIYEEDTQFSDLKVVGQSWKFAKVNGEPDLRYKDNYMVNDGEFGVVKISSNKGLRICLKITNSKAALHFVWAFEAYKEALQKQPSQIYWNP
ncbi:DUF4236 domain-containing protein [Rouxiella sp. T17]|uniref:DUF4236 domain-containing protein n=1 Tax=Rouxiella sp. T17 TaxID=3085684 RepID=UPI002FCB8732